MSALLSNTTTVHICSIGTSHVGDIPVIPVVLKLCMPCGNICIRVGYLIVLTSSHTICSRCLRHYLPECLSALIHSFCIQKQVIRYTINLHIKEIPWINRHAYNRLLVRVKHNSRLIALHNPFPVYGFNAYKPAWIALTVYILNPILSLDLTRKGKAEHSLRLYQIHYHIWYGSSFEQMIILCSAITSDYLGM